MKGSDYKFPWRVVALLVLCGAGYPAWALDESISPVPLPSDAPHGRAVATPGTVYQAYVEETGGDKFQSSRGTFHQLFFLEEGHYTDLKAAKPPEPFEEPNSWDHRTVFTHGMPPNLYLPHDVKSGMWLLTPKVFLAQRYDENLFMTREDKVRAIYYNLGVGADFSAGSIRPDTYGYDTIMAVSGSVLTMADIFNDYQQYNKINNKIELEGRLGRNEFILQPYLMAQEKTGSEIASVEQSGRLTIQELVTGLRHTSRLTDRLTLRSDFSHSYQIYPDIAYRDFEKWKAREELGLMIVPHHDYMQNDMWVNESEIYLWGEYANTNPSVGSGGQEAGGGIGWQGRFWERLVSYAYVGWSEVWLEEINNSLTAERTSTSGIRYGGFTRFEATHRLFIEVGYSRQYEFSNINLNDNFVATSGRAAINIFLSDNWYVIPQFVGSHAKYETSGLEELAWTPMLEINYRFNDYNKAFFRFEYERTDVLAGDAQPVDTKREIVGVSMEF